MILHGTVREEDFTHALITWRAHLVPGHPVLVLLEECRSYVRGERSALTAGELAPLCRIMQDLIY
jgi:hypothetical protein